MFILTKGNGNILFFVNSRRYMVRGVFRSVGKSSSSGQCVSSFNASRNISPNSIRACTPKYFSRCPVHKKRLCRVRVVLRLG